MAETYAPEDALGLVGLTVDQVRFDACVDAGGFGLIYRGFHEGLGEPVAIKALRIASIQKTNEAIREALAGRFRDETKLLYRLSQGNLDIVRCISSGTIVAPRTNEYTPYMVLEWLDGCTLSAELKERRERKLGARSLRAAVNLLDSAASGLAYAHTHDIVHRDVKPGNLFLTRTREGVRMKVLDFGLAKILSDETIGVRPSVETGVGVHFCSPSYGAPEQFTSQAGAIGPWTDVYSFCLVLLEVMTGQKVRPAGNLAQGLLAAIDPVRGSPSASHLGLKLAANVEALLLRAVAQDPKARPHDVGVFWTELKDAMEAVPSGDIDTTASDGSAPSAMQSARDEAVARVAALAAAAAAQPSPFVGTMLMDNAPAQPAALSTFPMARPAPDHPRDAHMKGTLPLGALQPKMPTPQAVSAQGLSPLAASVAIASPLAAQNLMAPYLPQQPGPTAPSSYPPGGIPSAPPLRQSERAQVQSTNRKNVAMSMIAIASAVALVVVLAVLYWLRLRHH